MARPVQLPLSDTSHEPRLQADAWTLEAPRPSIGTLPHDVYVGYRVLLTKGPLSRHQLDQELCRLGYDFRRAQKTIEALASCGYVTTDAHGVMRAHKE